MYKSKRILTIIPARGGSKGIKNKNLMRIGRYTLLEHVKNIIKPIEKKLDYVWVSTDSIKIINHCKKIGLNTPFVRPKKFSSDFANISDVLLHSINFLEKKVKQKADYILLLEPTSPLRKINNLKSCLDKCIDEDLDSCWTISSVDSKYHPFKQFKKSGDNINFFFKKGKSIYARQQLSQTFNKNGEAYVLNINSFKKNKKILGKKKGFIICKNNSISIDNYEDVNYAKKFLSTK